MALHCWSELWCASHACATGPELAVTAIDRRTECADVSAGSYVTHETKHFIYFYLGAQRLPQESFDGEAMFYMCFPPCTLKLHDLDGAGQVAVLLFKSG